MTHTFEAIGTRWQIDIYEALSPEREGVLLSAIMQRIDAFDRAYSRFRADSLVTEMSHTAGTYVLPDDAKLMLGLYYDLYVRTNGLMTPLIGQVLVDAGYDAQYSLTQHRVLTAPPVWNAVMQYAYPTLTIAEPTLLDFGAMGKGYLVDIVASVITAHGVTAYCVDAGGDIMHRNTTPIRIGLEHPSTPSQVIGVVTLHNQSICGSAGNRRVWREYTHIMNPETLTSVSSIVAVWVIADTTILADALTTALFFVPAATLNGYTFEYLLIRDDMSIEKSSGFVYTM